MTDFYAYVHTKPDTTIFYVGKGRFGRARDFCSGRNNYYKRTVTKYGAENILVGVVPCSSEKNAFDLEIGLIKCLRRAGNKLTNMTDGGEGTSGYKFSPESRAKMTSSRAMTMSIPEVRDRFVKAVIKARKGKKHTSASIQKMRESCSGRILSETHKRHISEGMNTPAAKAKLKASLKVSVQNPAWIEKTSPTRFKKGLIPHNKGKKLAYQTWNKGSVLERCKRGHIRTPTKSGKFECKACRQITAARRKGL